MQWRWALAVVLLAGGTLGATVSESASLRDLAAGASLIVRGTVTDVRAFRVPGAGIETAATVAVERVVKGDYEPFVTIRVPGGAVGRHRQITIGAPVLRPEQHAVFFLKRGADHAWRPVGSSAGVVRVRTESVTGRRLVAPVVLDGQTAAAGPVVRGDGRRRSLSVEEFEAIVLAALTPTPPAGAAP